MNDTEKIMDFLSKNSIQILSTSVDNHPISRPIGSATLINNKIYYCMNNDKAMFGQLQANPFICICVCASDFTWIRIFAKAIFDENKTIKQKFIELGKTRFSDINDKRFAVFYLSEIKAQIRKGLSLEEIEVK